MRPWPSRLAFIHITLGRHSNDVWIIDVLTVKKGANGSKNKLHDRPCSPFHAWSNFCWSALRDCISSNGRLAEPVCELQVSLHSWTPSPSCGMCLTSPVDEKLSCMANNKHWFWSQTQEGTQWFRVIQHNQEDEAISRNWGGCNCSEAIKTTVQEKDNQANTQCCHSYCTNKHGW